MPEQSLPTRRSIKHENSNDSIINVRLDCISGRKRPVRDDSKWYSLVCVASRVFILESAFCQQRPALMTRSSSRHDRDTIFVFGWNNKFIYSHRVDRFSSLRASHSRATDDRVGWKTWNIYSDGRLSLLILLSRELSSCFLVPRPYRLAVFDGKSFSYAISLHFLFFYHRATMSEPLTKRRQFHRSFDFVVGGMLGS